MSETSPQDPNPKSDDEWKDRVKADDAALDASAAPADAEFEMGPDHSHGMPPATFISLVHLLTAQAMAGLGLVPGPDGKPHRELSVARHFIDLLSVLEVKTKGQLDPDEALMLEDVLHDLRMAFVTSSGNA